MAALFAVTFGIANPFAAYGVFLPTLADAFAWSRGEVSIALSINLLLGGVFGFVAGSVADRYGPRIPLLVTVVLAGAGFGLVGVVGALWQLYLFVGVLGGIGMSSFYVVSAATISRWFDRQRGLALSVVLTGYNLGFITGGPLSAALLARLGWRAGYAAIACVLCGMAAVAALTVRFPSPTRDAGHAPTAERTRPRHDPAHGMELRHALADPRLWLFTASWFLVGGVSLMMSVHVVPYARDLGIALEGASLTLTAYGVGAVIGRVIFGFAADRFGALPMMWLTLGIQAAGLAPLTLGPSRGVLLFLLVVFGFGFAGADTVFVKAMPDVFGVRALGAIVGVLSLGWRSGAAIGPAAAGFVHDARGSYTIAFAAAPIAVIVSGVLFTLATAGRRGARPRRV